MSNSVTPLDQSLFHPSKFQLAFNRIANTVFYCTKVNLPGITLPALPQPTPFVNIYVPGNKLEFEPLRVTFLVDDTLSAWNDIFTWMTGLSGEDFSNYQGLATSATKNGVPQFGVRPPYSDATVTLYTSKNNAQKKFQYFDCFPVSLSPIEFEYSKSADEQLIATAVFRYSYYVFNVTS